MPTEVILLRLPRLVIGTVRRCRQPERVAVHDEVPVAVERRNSSKARQAWRGTNTYGTVYEASEGIPYAPLDHGRRGIPDLPGEMWAALCERIASEAGIGERRTDFTQQGLADWAAHLPDASARRGLVAAEAIGFQSIVDDGRAAQAELARRIGANLMSSGGRLYHRTSLPRVRVSAEGDDGCVHLRDVQPDLPVGGTEGEPLGWGDFRIDRREDAVAFRAAAMDELGLREPGTTPWSGLEVLDAGALAACYDRAGPESTLAAMAVGEGVRHALSPLVGELPDAGIEAYRALRGHLARRDGDAVEGWLSGIRPVLGSLDDVAGRKGGDGAGPAGRARAAIALALLRHRVVDVPRRHLDGGDGELLADLAPRR
jgi:hypothetical protein